MYALAHSLSLRSWMLPFEELLADGTGASHSLTLTHMDTEVWPGELWRVAPRYGSLISALGAGHVDVACMVDTNKETITSATSACLPNFLFTISANVPGPSFVYLLTF